MAKSELLGVVDDLQDSYEAGEGNITIGIDLLRAHSNSSVRTSSTSSNSLKPDTAKPSPHFSMQWPTSIVIPSGTCF